MTAMPSPIETPPLKVRAARAEDMAFISNAWIWSYYEGTPAFRGIADKDHFRLEMTKTIRRICDNAEVRVACDPSDEDTLVGFCAFGLGTLHYVYVKRDFRGMGVARTLLEGVPIKAYSFRTANAKPRAGWRFTPRFTW